jgi:hypothetical protein
LKKNQRERERESCDEEEDFGETSRRDKVRIGPKMGLMGK